MIALTSAGTTAAERPGFIDVETMKLSYPFAPDEEPPPEVRWSEDLTWATSSSKTNGLRLAKVVVR